MSVAAVEGRDPGSGDDFEAQALRWLNAINGILNEPQPAWWRPGRGVDPHRRELLQKIAEAIDDARALAATVEDARKRALIARAAAVLRTIEPDHLQRDAAAELLDVLRRNLIRVGDEGYLAKAVGSEVKLLRSGSADLARLVLEDARFPPPTVTDGRLQDPDYAAVWLLIARAVQGDWQRRRWVRLTLRSTIVKYLAAGLALLVAVSLVAVGLAGDAWSPGFVAVTSGALGAALSGMYKLRDEIAEARAIREFAPTIAAQVAAGAAAGILLLLVVRTGALNLGARAAEWAEVGVAAFVAGFSEPFLLGIVGKISRAP